MNWRDNVLIQHDAINPDDLRSLVDFVRKAPMTDSLVSDFDEKSDAGIGADVEWVINKAVRDTQEVELTPEIRARLSRIDDASIAAFINPYYRVDVRDREPSQILHYGVGGHYIPHVDAETLYKDDLGLDIWEKTLDRDLSIVYFLNDDYAGGELIFPDLDLRIQPQAGSMVCFPSDHNYVHGVKPVTSGHRYTIVTWMRIHGMPGLDEINEMTREEYNRTRPKQMVQPPRVMKDGKPTR